MKKNHVLTSLTAFIIICMYPGGIYASTSYDGKEFLEKSNVEYLNMLTRDTTGSICGSMLTSNISKSLRKQEASECNALSTAVACTAMRR